MTHEIYKTTYFVQANFSGSLFRTMEGGPNITAIYTAQNTSILTKKKNKTKQNTKSRAASSTVHCLPACSASPGGPPAQLLLKKKKNKPSPPKRRRFGGGIRQKKRAAGPLEARSLPPSPRGRAPQCTFPGQTSPRPPHFLARGPSIGHALKSKGSGEPCFWLTG